MLSQVIAYCRVYNVLCDKVSRNKALCDKALCDSILYDTERITRLDPVLHPHHYLHPHRAFDWGCRLPTS